MKRSEPMVPGDRPLVSIGQRHNARKVISFFATYNKGSTQAGIPNLYLCPDHCSYVSIRPVARILVINELYGSVNEDDFHKNQGGIICL